MSFGGFAFSSVCNDELLTSLGEGALQQAGTGQTGFNADILNYTTSVNYNISGIAMTAQWDDPGITVSYALNGGQSVPIAVSGARTILPLNMG